MVSIGLKKRRHSPTLPKLSRHSSVQLTHTGDQPNIAHPRASHYTCRARTSWSFWCGVFWAPDKSTTTLQSASRQCRPPTRVFLGLVLVIQCFLHTAISSSTLSSKSLTQSTSSADRFFFTSLLPPSTRYYFVLGRVRPITSKLATLSALDLDLSENIIYLNMYVLSSLLPCFYLLLLFVGIYTCFCPGQTIHSRSCSGTAVHCFVYYIQYTQQPARPRASKHALTALFVCSLLLHKINTKSRGR